MIGRPELSQLAIAGGVGLQAQEKDYVLAWLLAACATLGPPNLVFKGGTALRRCYFPVYRYSEDLDFSTDEPTTQDGLAALLGGWSEWIDEQVGISAQVVPDRRSGNGTVYLTFVGPLQAADGRSLKIDVATNESVREPSVERHLLSEYSDLDGDAYVLNVYSLVEIWAEKTRSLMQRSEPRDLYDLDQLLTEDGTLPDRALGLFERKSRAKDLDPTALFERLAEREKKFEQLWNVRLASQVADLDTFDGVWRRVLRGLRQAKY